MAPRVLILGIGNVLWADEGFGVRCVERLADTHAAGRGVTLLDGGTQGLYLLPYLEDADVALVFDAIDYGLPPGTLKLIEGDAVPAFMGAKKMSLHQTGFQDVIATAKLRGTCPETLILVGCQPEELDDYGGGLRESVARQIDPAITMALAKLAALGVVLGEGQSGREGLADPSILRGAYEEGRPSAEDACRIGDPRFLPAAE